MGRVKDLIGPRPKPELDPFQPSMLDAVFTKVRERKSRKYIRAAQRGHNCPDALSVGKIGRVKIGRGSDG